MKKRTLRASATFTSACFASMALVGCDDPAPGLKATAASAPSVYSDAAATVAPSSSGTVVNIPAKPPGLGESNAVAQAPVPLPEPSAPGTPVPLPTPSAPAPAPAPVPMPTPAPAPAPVPPPVPAPSPEPAPAPTPSTPAPAAATAAINGPAISIKPEMPKPLFVGTPLPQENAPPNLDKSGVPVLEVKVPEGTTLLSKGKPVTSNDSAPIGELSLATDGDKQGDDGYFVDLIPGKAWIQVDLGESKEIWLLWVWHFHKQNVIFKDVIAQISDDPTFATFTTVFNNDFDNSAGFGVGNDKSYIETNNGRPMPVNGVKGRYVRFYSNGRDLDDTNQYIEVEVYGK